MARTLLDELFVDLVLNTRKLRPAAKDAEKIMKDLQRQGTNVEKSMEGAGRGANTAAKGIDRVGRESRKTMGLLQRLKSRATVVIATFLGFQAIRSVLRGVVQETTNFDRAMGQVETLTNLSAGSFKALSSQVERLALVVPKKPEDLGIGLYQVISAGVTDAADAMTVLEASAKLASSGLLETEPAVDAVTTVLNAYGIEARNVTEVTDAFFQTVRLGKITVPELSNSIGTVATSAALAGIGLDDLGAAIATMTKLGIDAEITTTSLNRLFLSIVEPQEKAVEAARKLGVEWSLAGLEARGLAGFIRDLGEKTDGAIEPLTSLGLDLRAFRSLSVLAGVGAEELALATAEMGNKQGQAEAAFRKTNERMGAQATLIQNRLIVSFTHFGDRVLPGVISVLERLTRFIETDFEQEIRRLRDIGVDEDFIKRLITEEAQRTMTSRLQEVDDEIAALQGTVESFSGLNDQAVNQNIIAKLREEAVPLARELAEAGAELDRLLAARLPTDEVGQNNLVELARQRLTALRQQAEPITAQITALQTLVDLENEREEIGERQLAILNAQSGATPQPGTLTEFEILNDRAKRFDAEIRAALEQVEPELLRGIGRLQDQVRQEIGDSLFDIATRLQPRLDRSSFSEVRDEIANELGSLLADAGAAEVDIRFVGSLDQIRAVEDQINTLIASGNEQLIRRGEVLRDLIDQYNVTTGAAAELVEAELDSLVGPVEVDVAFVGSPEQIEALETQIGTLISSGNDDLVERGEVLRGLVDRYKEVADAAAEVVTEDLGALLGRTTPFEVGVEFVGSVDQIRVAEERINELVGSGNEELIRRGEVLRSLLDRYNEVTEAEDKLTKAENVLNAALAVDDKDKAREAVEKLRASYLSLLETLRVEIGDAVFDVPISLQPSLDRSAFDALRQEIATELSAVLDGTGPDGSDSAFVGSLDQIRIIEEQVNELIGSGNQALIDRGEHLRDLVDQYENVTDAEAAVTAAEKALNAALSTNDVAAQGDAVDALRKAYLALLTALRRVDDEQEGVSKSAKEIASAADEIADAARGVLRLADAFGVLDDDLRKTLDGAVELADSIRDIALEGPNIGNVIQGLGGLAGIGAGIVGLFKGDGPAPETPEAREARERQKANTEALLNLRDTIKDLADSLLDLPFGGVLSGISNAKKIAEGINQSVSDSIAALPLDDDAGLEALQAQFVNPLDQLRFTLAGLGLTMSDVEEVAAALGIEWDGTTRTMELLQEAIQQIDIQSVFDTFAGQMSLLRREFELFDIDDPAEQMSRLVAVLKNFTNLDVPDFDLATAAGREALDEFIRALFTEIGTLDPETLGELFNGLSPNEVLDVLGEIERLGDTFAGQDGDPTFTRNVEITEASASRLLALQTTLVTRAEQLVDLAIQRNAMLGLLSGVTATAVAGAAAPISASPAATLTVGEINVTVPITAAVGSTDDATEIGLTIGAGIAEALDIRLGDRQVRSSRTQGASEF